MSSNQSTKPILVGSRAVGLHTKDSDYDIISPYITRNTNNWKSWFADKPDPPIDFFRRDYDLELMVHLNSVPDVKIQKVLDFHCIIAPKEIVAMMLLSSIIRIVPQFDNHDENVQVWLSRVDKYNKLRSMIDSKKFDYDILVDEDSFLYQQYHTRVDDKFKRYGDTLVTLRENENVFFKDGVKRIYDHDYLHEIVAELNRGDTTLIFPKFKNPDNPEAGLDQALFEKGCQEDKIAMVQEEILALILERKIIPALHQEKKYDLENFDRDANDIASHFATNLCGQDYHFLRKWVLDHFTILMNIQVPARTLVARAYQLCNIEIDEIDLNPIRMYSGLTAESLRLYRELADHHDLNFLKSSDGQCKLILNGPETGMGYDESGDKFWMEISIVDRVCIFKQIYLEKDEINDGICLRDKVISTTKNLVTYSRDRVTVRRVHHRGYYDSYDSEASYDEDIETDLHRSETTECIKKKKRVSYYLNSYGSIKKFTLCERIAKYLLKS